MQNFVGQGRVKIVGNRHLAAKRAEFASSLVCRNRHQSSDGNASLGNGDFLASSNPTEKARETVFRFVCVYFFFRSKPKLGQVQS